MIQYRSRGIGNLGSNLLKGAGEELLIALDGPGINGHCGVSTHADDCGIITVASALIGVLDAFADIGADISVIRHADPQRRHYDTAWTFTIIPHGAGALLIALGAPLAAHIYDDQRYEGVLQVLAPSMLMTGFANIGIANFHRDLEFNKDFKYNAQVQAVGVLNTPALVFLFRSYWALELGGLARSIAAVALSFAMEEYRPRL